MKPPKAIALMRVGNEWCVATAGDIAVGSEIFIYIRADFVPESLIEDIREGIRYVDEE